MPKPVRLFSLLDRARTALFARANAEAIAELSVSVPQLVLLFSLPREGGARPSELAASLEVDAAAVTRLVDRLEAAGFVRRELDPDDGRSRRVAITDAGWTVRTRGASAVARANAALAAPFSTEELATVARFLEHVVAYGRGGGQS